MKINVFKLSALLILLSSYTFGTEISLAEVQSLYPFGKTEEEINATIKTLKSSNKSVQDALNEHFEQNEQDILAQFQAAFPNLNLNFDGLEAFKQQSYIQNPLFTTQPALTDNLADLPLIKRSKEIIASLGMNPQQVRIITDFDAEDDDTIIQKPLIAASGTLFAEETNSYENYLTLNLKSCRRLTDEEFNATIAHECMHFWYADLIKMQYIIKQVKQARKILCDSAQNYMQADRDYFDSFKVLLENNFEMRADIMSALCSEEYHDGSYTFWKKVAPRWPADADLRHPHPQQRADALQQLKSYLEKEKNI